MIRSESTAHTSNFVSDNPQLLVCQAPAVLQDSPKGFEIYRVFKHGPRVADRSKVQYASHSPRRFALIVRNITHTSGEA